jgi:four helix bundle protein
VKVPPGRTRRGFEATRGKSTADFISKIEGSLQELEESEYWLELLAESGFYPEERLLALKKETGDLMF